MEQAIEVYQVNTAHKRFGNNWGSYKVAARNADEALRKAKKKFMNGERLESLYLLASTR